MSDYCFIVSRSSLLSARTICSFAVTRLGQWAPLHVYLCAFVQLFSLDKFLEAGFLSQWLWNALSGLCQMVTAPRNGRLARLSASGGLTAVFLRNDLYRVIVPLYRGTIY